MNTERIPLLGQKDGADFETPLFAFQVKLGYRPPAYLLRWLRGIVTTSVPRNKVGIVLWKPKYGRDRDTLVILRYEDWVALHGNPEHTSGPFGEDIVV